MKRTMIYLVVTLMMISATVAVTFAASDKEVTIKGEVIDQLCYDSGGKRGDSHKACALSCAKRGNQMAVIEDETNTIYSVTGDYAANKNEKLIPFVAEMVEVKGTVTEKDGKKWLAVSSIKKVEKK